MGGAHGYVPIVDQWTATLTWAWQKAHRAVGLDAGGILLLQTAALTIGIYLVLRSRLGRAAAAAWTTLVLLAPPAFGLVGLVGRDAWFTASCVLAVGMAVLGVRETGSRTRTAALLAGVAFAAIAIAARQNGLTAVAPILVALAVPALDVVWERGREPRLLRRHPALAATAIGALATCLIGAAGVLASNSVRDRASHPEVVTYLYDLGYLTAQAKRQLVPSMPYASVATQTVDEVQRRWRPHNAIVMRTYDPAWGIDADTRAVKNARVRPRGLAEQRFGEVVGLLHLRTNLFLTESEVTMLEQAWRDAVRDRPLDYLRGRWELWLLQIGVGRPADATRIPGSTPGTYGYEPPAFPALSQAASAYARFWGSGGDLDLTGGPIHTAWIYLLVCVAGLALALPRFPRAMRLAAALPAAALGLQVGLFFMAPAAVWRFQVLTVYAAMVVAILLVRVAFEARSEVLDRVARPAGEQPATADANRQGDP
jgi:hypothetical protein